MNTYYSDWTFWVNRTLSSNDCIWICYEIGWTSCGSNLFSIFFSKIILRLYSHSENNSKSKSLTSSLKTNKLFLPSFNETRSDLSSSSFIILPACLNTYTSNNSSHIFLVFSLETPLVTLNNSIIYSICFVSGTEYVNWFASWSFFDKSSIVDVKRIFNFCYINSQIAFTLSVSVNWFNAWLTWGRDFLLKGIARLKKT